MSRSTNHHYYHHDDHSNYRLALSYNDQGIVYMKRRHYDEAIMTFQMALTIMKEVVMISNVVNDSGDSTTNSMILNPEQQQQHCCPTATTASTISISTTTTIVIKSDDEEDNKNEIMIMSSDTQMMMNINTTKICNFDKLWPIGIDPPMIDRELLLRNVEGGGADDNNNHHHNNDRTDKWERMTVIILYNIGLCKMNITTTPTSSYSSSYGNVSSSSHKSASVVLGLAWQLLHGMIQRFEQHHCEDDNTIPAWYGLHQIEMMILSAIIQHPQHHMMMMTTPPPLWWFQHRQQHVQRILQLHYNMITFLSMFTTNHPIIAPCA